MTVAAERLAVIAAVTLPITAPSSVLGMNPIVNEGTHWMLLWIIVAVLSAMSTTLLVWAKRKGWFSRRRLTEWSGSVTGVRCS